MIGKYELEITTRRVDYKLTLERNITILRGKTDPGMQDKIFFCEVNKKIHCHRLVSRGTSLGCSLASEYRHYRYVPNRRSVTA